MPARLLLATALLLSACAAGTHPPTAPVAVASTRRLEAELTARLDTLESRQYAQQHTLDVRLRELSHAILRLQATVVAAPAAAAPYRPRK